MLKKSITLITIFWGCLCQIMAQNNLSNEEKYNILRDRLRSDFMYYTGDGMERGSSLVMERKYQSNRGTTGLWTDAVWWQGHYLALLATEYARLQQEGKNTEATLEELRCAVQVYERLDLEAESCWGCDTLQQCNGFYLRDDIRRDDTTRFNLNWIISDYIYHCGNLHTKGNSPSQDQAWGSYLGFALVQKLVDDSLLCHKVAQISEKMISAMQYDADGKTSWAIVNPVNHMEIQSSSDISWLEYAHATIGDLLSGHPVSRKRANAGRSNWNMVQSIMLAAKNGNFRWYGILAMSSVMNEGGGSGNCYEWLVRTCDKIAQKRPDLQQELIFPHLPLINLILYGQEGEKILPRSTYDPYLNSAPTDGCITHYIDGKTVRNAPPWHSLSLFCPWHLSETGQVNMIDYLLLYNLVELVYHSESKQ